MENLSEDYLLMIEPDYTGTPSKEPINDELTEKVKFIFSKAEAKYHCRGFHLTRCKQASDASIWVLPNGMEMNSLCIYYVQYYRPYVPQSELDKIHRVYASMEYLNE